jgi:hypothetical protein
MCNQIRKSGRILLLLFLGFMFCTDSVSASGKVVLKQKNISLYIGKSAIVKTKTGGKIISCKSSAVKVVSVNHKGHLLARKPGKATIIVTTKKGKTKCKVNVGAYVTKLTMKSANSYTMSVGETSQLQTTILPAKVLYSSCTYYSQNKSIATVNKKGKITAKASGLTYIILKSKAVTKRKHHLSLKAAVYVTAAANTSPVSLPASNSVVITTSPAALQAQIDAIATPSTSTQLAASYLVQEGSSYKTLYFLNKNYLGRLNGKIYGYEVSTSRTMSELLSYTSNVSASDSFGKYLSLAGKRVLYMEYVGNGSLSIQNLSTSDIMHGQLYTTDTVYHSPYAVLVMQNDTRQNFILP